MQTHYGGIEPHLTGCSGAEAGYSEREKTNGLFTVGQCSLLNWVWCDQTLFIQLVIVGP